MITANATWGAMLRDAGVPALYRVQTAGKVRMSTVAAAHEGLGVDCYAWSSSPLRRYCDLLNQWQLLALLRDEKPYFPPKSAELLAAMRDFELSYAAYAEFQRGMERYWCLRWLLQEGAWTVTARVLRENLLRLVQQGRRQHRAAQGSPRCPAQIIRRLPVPFHRAPVRLSEFRQEQINECSTRSPR